MLAGFFQDVRVKVSLFLQEGIQTSSGHILLPGPFAKRGLAVQQEAGTVILYSQDGRSSSKEKVEPACAEY